MVEIRQLLEHRSALNNVGVSSPPYQPLLNYLKRRTRVIIEIQIARQHQQNTRQIQKKLNYHSYLNALQCRKKIMVIDIYLNYIYY